MKRLLLIASLLAAAHAGAAPRMDPAALRRTAEQFLQVQTAALPGKVSVSVNALDPRLALAPCPAPEAFLMPGARAWGKTTVGLRCTAPAPWTIYVQAQVSVLGDYVAAAVPLAPGQAVDAAQLVMLQGELTNLPPGIATDKAQVIGRHSTLPVAAGMPLRVDLLKSQPVILQGQLVRLVSRGNGFSVTAEGKAAASAADGQVVAVRTGNGQQINGIARAGGLVEVVF